MLNTLCIAELSVRCSINKAQKAAFDYKDNTIRGNKFAVLYERSVTIKNISFCLVIT